MMLRNRTANIQNQQPQPGAAPQKRQAGGLKPRVNVNAAGDNGKLYGEPEAKRANLSQLSHVLSGVVLDSAKKQTAGDAKGGLQKRRGPRIIDTNEDAGPIVSPPGKGVAQRSTAAVAPQPENDLYPDIDFDKDNARDLSALSEYARDIFRYYTHREAEFKVGNYYARQPQITEKARAEIVSWIVTIQEQFELNHETLYLAVKIIDIYLDRRPNIRRSQFKLVAATAVLIAAKYDERQAPLLDDFQYICSDEYPREEIIVMERELFREVGFDLCMPSSYRFVRRFARVNKVDMATLTLARYILETSLLFLDFCRVSESRMAAAALMLAMRMKLLPGWSRALHKYTGYTDKEVEPLMWCLNHMLLLRKTVFPRNKVIADKYSHEVFYEVGLLRPLADRFQSTEPVGPPKELLPPTPSGEEQRVHSASTSRRS